jgi:hypothetical protein
MEITKYDIQFAYGKPYTAHCDEFIGGARHPQIFVWVSRKKQAETFTYYKCPDELFWFELLPDDEALAYAIATVIGRKYNLRVHKRNGIQMEV